MTIRGDCLPKPRTATRANLLLEAGADLLLGATCPGCGRPGFRLCPECGVTVAAHVARPRHKTALEGLPVWATLPYAGLASRLITAAKDRHRWDLLPTLSDCLALALAGLLDTMGTDRAPPPDSARTDRAPPPNWARTDLDRQLDSASTGLTHLTTAGPLAGWPTSVIGLVPIPSSAAAVRRRGLDVAGRLAQRAGRRLGEVGVTARVVPLLRIVRPVADQSGLGSVQRRANLAGAYGLARGWAAGDRWGPLVLVDDVVTTGASLAEGWRVVRTAGGTVLGAATVAATEEWT